MSRAVIDALPSLSSLDFHLTRMVDAYPRISQRSNMIYRSPDTIITSTLHRDSSELDIPCQDVINAILVPSRSKSPNVQQLREETTAI